MNNYQKVVSLDNEVEASFMEDILNDREIDFNIISHHSLAFDGIFQMKEWGYIEAAPENHQVIKELYQEMLDNLDKK